MKRDSARSAGRVPTATVSRLVTYYRILSDIEEAWLRARRERESGLDANEAGRANGRRREPSEPYVSSDTLAEEAGVSAFQVRKDLTYFGTFGTRGSGYVVPFLVRQIREILGLTRGWNLAIMGAGRLGQALADYPNFGHYNFILKAGFDVDPAKHGMRMGAATVYPVTELARQVAELDIDIAFLTVPIEAAQEAANQLADAGVKGILNFVPSLVTVPPTVHVEQADFLAGVKRLAFFISRDLTPDPSRDLTPDPSPDLAEDDEPAGPIGIGADAS